MTRGTSDRPLWAPAIGTIVFVSLVPGTVVGVVPYLLSGWRVSSWAATQWLVRAVGALLFLAATPLFVDFVLRFVREGRGTPAPIAPTQHLVVGGPYQYIRNPGYIAVVAMLLGQGLFLGSIAIVVYAVVVAAGFHVFVLGYEEPTLRRQFGSEYDTYCRTVPRWFPRRSRAS